MLWLKLLILINSLNKLFVSKVDIIYKQMLNDILKDIQKTFELELKQNKKTYTVLNKKRRMDMLMKRIKERNNVVFNTIIDEIELMNKEIYSESFLRLAHNLEMQAKFNLGFSLPSERMINKILENPIDKLKLPRVLSRNKKQVLNEIRSIISQGVLMGESYSNIASRIEGRLNVSKTKAIRTARTETGRASSMAQEEVVNQVEKNTGIKIEKYWVSALDTRVRASHRHLDGDKADENGYFHSRGHRAKMPRMFGVANEDINCRCGVIHRLPKMRRSGKNIIPYMSYED